MIIASFQELPETYTGRQFIYVRGTHIHSGPKPYRVIRCLYKILACIAYVASKAHVPCPWTPHLVRVIHIVQHELSLVPPRQRVAPKHINQLFALRHMVTQYNTKRWLEPAIEFDELLSTVRGISSGQTTP